VKKKSTPYIRKRGEGDKTRYFVQIYTGRDAAHRPQFIHKTFDELDSAEGFVLQTLADRKRGAILPTSGTVNELLDDLLREQEILGRKNIAGAERVVRIHLRDYFGKLRVDRVTSSTIAAYIVYSKARGLAPATINNHLAALRHAFNLGLRSTPPKVARVPYFPLLRVNNARQGFFEMAEYEKLFRELPVDLRPVLCFGFYTGCRRSEVLGLHWMQVDLERAQIRLERGSTRNDEPRTIPLAQQLLEVLRMQWVVREEYWPRCPHVFFWHASGKRIKSFGGSWSAACKRARLWDEEQQKPNKLFHDLRRSAVRNMERAGVGRKTAMAISGRKTESIYARYNIVDEADLQSAARRLGEYTANSAAVIAKQDTQPPADPTGMPVATVQ
jgi:integrase